MAGDERRRLCTQCQLHVEDVTDATAEEREHLWQRARSEQVCVRRPLLPSETTPDPRGARRWLGIALGMGLAACTPHDPIGGDLHVEDPDMTDTPVRTTPHEAAGCGIELDDLLVGGVSAEGVVGGTLGVVTTAVVGGAISRPVQLASAVRELAPPLARVRPTPIEQATPASTPVDRRKARRLRRKAARAERRAAATRAVAERRSKRRSDRSLARSSDRRTRRAMRAELRRERRRARAALRAMARAERIRIRTARRHARQQARAARRLSG